MKKFIVSCFLGCLALCGSAFGSALDEALEAGELVAKIVEEAKAHKPKVENPWYLSLSPEIRISYFHFSNWVQSTICGDGALNVQAGFTYPFFFGTKLWVSASKIHGQGYSLYEADLTTMDVYPINLGLRYGEWAIPFGGKAFIQVGPSYYHMHSQNNSDFVRPNFHKNGIGMFVGTGSTWHIEHGLHLDLFVEYSHRWVNHIRPTERATSRHSTMNGWDFGGGVHYVF